MGAPQGLSKYKARCMMVVQGGPGYTDRRPTVGCAKDEWRALREQPSAASWSFARDTAVAVRDDIQVLC